MASWSKSTVAISNFPFYFIWIFSCLTIILIIICWFSHSLERTANNLLTHIKIILQEIRCERERTHAEESAMIFYVINSLQNETKLPESTADHRLCSEWKFVSFSLSENLFSALIAMCVMIKVFPLTFPSINDNLATH